MNITEVCIKRPVFATVITLMIVVIGIVFYGRLAVREYPNVEKSIITVETEFRGANPQVVENQISKILEGQFATIPGVESIISNSVNENSEINIEFSPEREIDGAASDVRDRISLVKNQLPHGIHDPIIRKSNSNASAGMFIIFTSDKMSTGELYDYVERFVKQKFEMIAGVARVSTEGGGVKTVRVFIDPHKLASLGYTPADVIDALYAQHIQRPLGRIVGQDREFMITADCQLTTPAQFDEITLPIKGARTKVVKIKDIGRTEFINEEKRDGAFFNGKEAVSLAITKQSVANPLTISKHVKKILPEVKEVLPKDVDVIIAMDEAEAIEASMNNVFRAIIESIVLVILVVFFFLWSPRATLIPIVTIPVSLIGTFALLFFFGFSINTFTLLGMVLAVGLVVDDAIVVLENVYRHMERGESRLKASINASKEISFAVIAMTLTLATAYAPIALTPGRIGRMLREFAVSLAGSVIISGIVALTLSPMMCSKLLPKSGNEDFKSNFMKNNYARQQTILQKIDDFYLKILNFTFAHRMYVWISALFILIIGGTFMAILPSENLPKEDRGYVNIRGESPTGATYTYVEQNALLMDRYMSELPDTSLRYVRADANGISGFIKLTDWSERSRSAQKITDMLNDSFKNVSGVIASSYTFSGGGEENVEFVIQTNQGYPYLEKYGNYFSAVLQYKYSGLARGIRSTLLPAQQEYMVSVDRDKAAAVGVTAMDVIDAIETSIKGKKAGNVYRESYSDELFVQLDKTHRETTDVLKDIYVRAQMIDNKKSADDANMIPVTDLVEVKVRLSPASLYHNNKMLAASFTAQVAPGYSLGQVVSDLKSLKAEYLPETTILSFAGATQNYLEDGKQMVFVFILSLIFVFLVLAAQFESFWDPLIIMLSVPLAVSGALFLLYVIPSGSLNVYSKIGLVTLIGLITKHGILIVDFANKIHETGVSVVEAVSKAAHIRLRPILMTTLAMVLGAVPLALATGAGAGSRRQIGYSIIGGMSFGTIFTLVMLPTIYISFINFKERFLISKDTQDEE